MSLNYNRIYITSVAKLTLVDFYILAVLTITRLIHQLLFKNNLVMVEFITIGLAVCQALGETLNGHPMYLKGGGKRAEARSHH